MASDDLREREKIVKEIAKTSESIRKKHRALKTGKIEEDIAVKRHLGPIIEPLQKIVDNSSAIKDEPKLLDDNAEIGTTPKRENDTLLKRRKRLYLSDNSSTELHKIRKKLFKSDDASPPITFTPHTTIEAVQPTTTTMTTTATTNEKPPEDVFETSGESLATSVRNEMKTSEGQKALHSHLGLLGQEYIGAVLRNDKEKSLDTVYGVYIGKDGLMFGNKRFDVDNEDNIIINGVRYIGTPGLYELIFKRIPDDEVYTENDMKKYKNMLQVTSAHKLNYDANARTIGNRGYKYKHIIAPLMSIEPKKTTGGGLPRAMTLNDNAIDYVYWDDPNELVDRLRLLDASHQAGHNAHDNEMLSIIEELREAGIIIN